MLVVYIDESGINWKRVNNFWVDGPYMIWAAVLIPENKYFHLEQMMNGLAREILKIKRWNQTELHASELWRQAETGTREKGQVRTYFEELFQLLAKMSLHVVCSLQQKSEKIYLPSVRKNRIRKSMNAFLQTLEYSLADLNQTGILIADCEAESERIRNTDLARMVLDKTKWRYNPGLNKRQIIAPKYTFEAQSCFIIDQLFCADSKESLFVQLADHVSFVLQRVFTYLYLKQFSKPGRPPADPTKVPVSSGTFNLFVLQNNLKIACYDDKSHDINFQILDNSVFGSVEYLNNMSLRGVLSPYN